MNEGVPKRDLRGFAERGRGEQPPTRADGVILDVPAALNTVRPVSLLKLDGLSAGKLPLRLYSCRVMRDTPALELKPSAKPGRWSIIETDEPQRTVAHLGMVDIELQFLWANGVTEELAELLRSSFLIVGEGTDARGYGFNAPQLLPAVEVDLEKPKTTVQLDLSKIYPPDDIRMSVLSVGVPGLWVEDLSELAGLADGDTVTLTHAKHPHVSVECQFKVRGKSCASEFSFRYQIPGGREFGLTASHVRRTTAELQNSLQLASKARSALHSLQDDAARITRLINRNANNAHLRPQLVILENQIKTAQALVANEEAMRAHLRFMQDLVPIGEAIQRDASVSCFFYIDSNGCRLPLTAR
ncbi:hypothetical protein KOR34_19550 [Posidoniimonas corsicana]|uniref:Uncharacterized protein n=2 Tax=Posidoniimonas corsicana TaxID=1938618 RepID=A0A5C5VGI3_9BACT|nr:hypothetical protein KOR34_19550 [Posidoniimonas corsicana]